MLRNYTDNQLDTRIETINIMLTTVDDVETVKNLGNELLEVYKEKQRRIEEEENTLAMLKEGVTK